MKNIKRIVFPLFKLLNIINKILYKRKDKNRNNNKKNVTLVSNYKVILHFLTSKYFFYSFGKYPIKPSRKQKVINLWHGTPLKNIGNLERDKKNIDYNFFSNILATSDV